MFYSRPSPSTVFRQEYLDLQAALDAKTQQLADAKKAAAMAESGAEAGSSGRGGGDEDGASRMRAGGKKGFAPVAAGGDVTNPLKKAAQMRASRS